MDGLSPTAGGVLRAVEGGVGSGAEVPDHAVASEAGDQDERSAPLTLRPHELELHFNLNET